MTTKRDILWGYAAQFLNLTVGLILLPVILRYFSPEEVGLWFVFLTLASFAQLLEFGFQPTLARNTAYVYAGAALLSETDLPTASAGPNPIQLQLLADLVAAAKKIYLYVALVAAFVLLIGGSLYVYSLAPTALDAVQLIAAWVCFALGYIITFYYGYLNGLLQGRGDIALANKAVVITKGSLVVLGAVAVVAGTGLLGLGVASLLSCVFGRVVSVKYFHSSSRPEMRSLSNHKGDPTQLVKSLWHNASRLGTVHLGAFLILRANVLVASSFLGLTAGASYGMTLTVLVALTGLASVICQVQLPRMNLLQVQRRMEELRATYGAVLIIAWIVLIGGAVVLLLFGADALKYIGSKTELLPFPALLTLTVVMALEMNHAIAAGYLTTTNRIDFVRAAVFSGIFTIIGSVGLVQLFGVWALIGSQGFVQLAYNNWKWPTQAFRHLGSSPIQVLRQGFFVAVNVWRR